MFERVRARELDPRGRLGPRGGFPSTSRGSARGSSRSRARRRRFARGPGTRSRGARRRGGRPAPRSTIAAAFSPDGKLIASTHGATRSSSSTAARARVCGRSRGTDARRGSCGSTDNPDVLASGSLDHEVRLWSAKPRVPRVLRLRQADREPAFTPGDVLAVASGHKLYTARGAGPLPRDERRGAPTRRGERKKKKPLSTSKRPRAGPPPPGGRRFPAEPPRRSARRGFPPRSMTRAPAPREVEVEIGSPPRRARIADPPPPPLSSLLRPRLPPQWAYKIALERRFAGSPATAPLSPRPSPRCRSSARSPRGRGTTASAAAGGRSSADASAPCTPLRTRRSLRAVRLHPLDSPCRLRRVNETSERLPAAQGGDRAEARGGVDRVRAASAPSRGEGERRQERGRQAEGVLVPVTPGAPPGSGLASGRAVARERARVPPRADVHGAETTRGAAGGGGGRGGFGGGFGRLRVRSRRDGGAVAGGGGGFGRRRRRDGRDGRQGMVARFPAASTATPSATRTRTRRAAAAETATAGAVGDVFRRSAAARGFPGPAAAARTRAAEAAARLGDEEDWRGRRSAASPPAGAVS